VTHGLTVAEGKGGWIMAAYSFPSAMAQNFWVAIAAWTVCFFVTILVSLVTEPKKDSELSGLVYGLTKLPADEHEPWYKRPAQLALLVGALVIVLNIIFW
jgi:SSS family solute:Na+ symporter